MEQPCSDLREERERERERESNDISKKMKVEQHCSDLGACLIITAIHSAASTDGVVPVCFQEEGSNVTGPRVYSTSWSGFHDDHSGVAYYRVGLLAEARQEEVVPLHFVGLRTCEYCLLLVC